MNKKTNSKIDTLHGQIYEVTHSIVNNDGKPVVEVHGEIVVDHNEIVTVDQISDFVNEFAQELDITLKGILDV